MIYFSQHGRKLLRRTKVTWRPVTGGCQHHSLLPQHSPKLSTRNLIVCFLEVDKTCVNVFGIRPRFLKNLLESEIYVCGAMSTIKIALVSFSFRGIFFQGHLATVKYLKIPTKHGGPHKTPSRATWPACFRPCFRPFSTTKFLFR